MTNLEIYEKVRAVPKEAQKSIGGGRLKGMTDINPMWRIKCLTEQFGPCGIGWYYEITDKWIETAMAKDEITANVKINLYIKIGDEWSKPIVGVGGSMLVASERNGLYVNDECYKMALTDAISVACKALGMGADIYWGNDNTKYNDAKKKNVPKQSAPKPQEETSGEEVEKPHMKQLEEYIKANNLTLTEVAKDYNLNGKTSDERFAEVLKDLKGE